MSFFRLPVIGLAMAFATLVAIDRWIIPVHHASASREGIFAIECIVLAVLFGAAIWDKVRVMRRTIQMDHEGRHADEHELFTWNEIGKVLACLAASMVIFVAVVKVLDLKSAASGQDRQNGHSLAPTEKH